MRVKVIRLTVKRIGIGEHCKDYEIVSLQNATKVTISGKSYRAGDRLLENDVDILCDNEEYIVTVKKA